MITANPAYVASLVGVELTKLQFEAVLTTENIKRLVASPLWPSAVPSQLIVTNDEQKQNRAKSICVAYFNKTTPEESILEYGCEEGHITRELRARGKPAYGFNPTVAPNEFLFKSLDDIPVKQFKYILLYDQIDHWGNNPDETMAHVLNRLLPDGQLIIRLHPYTAIHGTHLYLTLNKAFAHLFLSNNDIIELGGVQTPTIKLTNPIAAYVNFFNRNKLRIIKKEIIKQPLPEFFDNSLMKYLIDTLNQPNLLDTLPINFVDLVVTK